ncbi:hypothetical protein [Deinococcus aerophilus]|uniref:KfrA N-terminal DNA-binding domain-containing protein n=1 Tax=Deinococcus aerophilus TaxID=522488 RepID=A0ABQ2GWC8_9DEIO|nr:hypothetical protein [Deinococcus aerophilus]GGM16964.1 hypothetical protein GCM10010841_26570 [Deinococcus aerophilus]
MSETRKSKGIPELDREKQRRSVISARHHVGAAGFAQSEALELIVSAGREQIGVAQALRQVVRTTQSQLRNDVAETDSPAAQAHVARLEQVIASGQAQIDAAHLLQQAIQDALTNVRGTPLENISAGLLTTLGAVVQRQARALEDLITVAISEAANDEQVRALEQVSADVTERLEAAERERTERELVHLDDVHQQALLRIRQLEQGGQTHAAQKMQLSDEAESSRRNIEVLEAAETRNLEQIADLEERQRTSEARRAQLEAAAAEHQDRIEELESRSREEP